MYVKYEFTVNKKRLTLIFLSVCKVYDCFACWAVYFISARWAAYFISARFSCHKQVATTASAGWVP